MPDNIERGKKEVISQFIVEVLVQAYADENKISPTTSDIDSEVDKIRKDYTSDLLFKETLAQTGQLTTELREKVRKTLLKRAVMEKILEDSGLAKDTSALAAEIKNYYNSHQGDFKRAPEIKLSQIVLSSQKEAEELRKRIKNGDIKFEEAAKRFSLSPDGKKGGDIGFLSKGAVPAFDIAFGWPLFQLSSVTKSPYGYHIMKVTDKRAALNTSLEAARPKILKLVMEQKREEAFKNWLEKQVKLAKIEKDSVVIDALKVYTK
jgi:peptidyl-prolyl cis-trans isomerase C